MRALLAVFLPLLVAYGATLQWCIDRWNAPTRYFEHCWLVPFIALAVLWVNRADWRARAARFDRTGFWLLGPALALHLVGAGLMIDSWSAASLVLAVPGAAWLALGRERLRGQWPVLWFVLFLVPLPFYVEGRLAFHMKEFAVRAGSWLANVAGADMVRRGEVLQPEGLPGALAVEDACGGLRSLMAMLTVAYCLAFFMRSKAWPRRWLLMAVAAPLAIAANVVRIAVLCLLARWFGVGFAEGTGHTLANIAAWIAEVLALLAFDAWLVRRFAGAVVSSAPSTAAGPAPRALSVGLGLWLAALPLLALCLYRPFVVGHGRAEKLPSTLAGYDLVPRTPEKEAKFRRDLPRWNELLGTADFVWRHYSDGGQSHINLVAVFHDANWKSVHPPRICIEGSNMTIEEDGLVPAPGLGEDVVAGLIVARSNWDERRYVSLSVYGTRDWTSGDYTKFMWHHLPLAVLRQSESGFLLRVESQVEARETVGDAQARCAKFLGELVPLARGILR
ncbi:MAG TPA: exosortase/archaeosortase family protein [Planctomycetota bacterium]|nr:exosortase/archaeosortase family protein [Planctomycetota bacterium]